MRWNQREKKKINARAFQSLLEGRIAVYLVHFPSPVFMRILKTCNKNFSQKFEERLKYCKKKKIEKEKKKVSEVEVEKLAS